MTLLKHESKAIEPAGERLELMFDRLFEDWLTALPLRRSLLGTGVPDVEPIRVEEFQEDGTLVVRAELPGIDPDTDVELSVTNGMLHIQAERREEEDTRERGYLRRELRYGSFSRTLPLPPGASEADVHASYKDGILEVRVPSPAPALPETRKVPITRG